jgi:hypothetical protein
MPFLAETHVPIPNQDLLSWMFDNPSYDIDMPVRKAKYKVSLLLTTVRFTLMQPILLGQFQTARHAELLVDSQPASGKLD